MQINESNIQKVSSNPNPFTHKDEATYDKAQNNQKEQWLGLVPAHIPSLGAILMALLEKLAIPGTALKAILLRQIETFSIKKAIFLGKLAIVLILVGFFFKDELNFSIQLFRQQPVAIHGLDEDNPQAPANPASLRDMETLEFIKTYKNLAISEMKATGIPASIKMAQAIIESRSGRSQLAVRNNNHFGIKCFSKRCSKGHCSNFKDDHHKDFFRIFPEAEGSWKAHSFFLQKPRYERLFLYGKDYKAWAKGLQTCGYATDQKYGSKLIRIIERYQLYELDQ